MIVLIMWREQGSGLCAQHDLEAVVEVNQGQKALETAEAGWAARSTALGRDRVHTMVLPIRVRVVLHWDGQSLGFIL